MKEKILQFGEGNFLRCFVQYKMQQKKNAGFYNGNVDVITPINTTIVELFEKQKNEYYTSIRGKLNGQIVDEITKVDVINSIVNPYTHFEDYKNLYMDENLGLIISNTTEAGIAYTETDDFNEKITMEFPGKLTKLLYDRYKKYGSNGGLTFLCVELIDNNAKNLQKCIHQYINLWKLENDFKVFVDTANTFTNTLVDRIVTGHPKYMAPFAARTDFNDELLVVGEPYFLWVIEGDKNLKERFSFLNDEHIVFTDDLKPYRESKVKILNGSHTMLVPIALLFGVEYVGDAMTNASIRGFLERVLANEVLPTIALDDKTLQGYKTSIFERFENPFVQHSFYAIALNSISKWKTRDLCSVTDYFNKTKQLPKGLLFSLAAMIKYYVENVDTVQDSESVLAFFQERKEQDIYKTAQDFMQNESFFDKELVKISGASDYVLKVLKYLSENEIAKGLKNYENL